MEQKLIAAQQTAVASPRIAPSPISTKDASVQTPPSSPSTTPATAITASPFSSPTPPITPLTPKRSLRTVGVQTRTYSPPIAVQVPIVAPEPSRAVLVSTGVQITEYRAALTQTDDIPPVSVPVPVPVPVPIPIPVPVPAPAPAPDPEPVHISEPPTPPPPKPHPLEQAYKRAQEQIASLTEHILALENKLDASESPNTNVKLRELERKLWEMEAKAAHREVELQEILMKAEKLTAESLSNLMDDEFPNIMMPLDTNNEMIGAQ